MSLDPYQPPAPQRSARPLAIACFRVYAGAMALLWLGLAVLALSSRAAAGTASSTSLLVAAGIALVLAILYGIATFVPYAPWGWTWALVAIAFGAFGGGALFAIPLLFFWFKPQVKAAFARL